jgi:hypothetical protein
VTNACFRIRPSIPPDGLNAPLTQPAEAGVALFGTSDATRDAGFPRGRSWSCRRALPCAALGSTGRLRFQKVLVVAEVHPHAHEAHELVRKTEFAVPIQVSSGNQRTAWGLGPAETDRRAACRLS